MVSSCKALNLDDKQEIIMLCCGEERMILKLCLISPGDKTTITNVRFCSSMGDNQEDGDGNKK